MGKTVTPQGYRSVLDIYETQTAIGMLKRTFETELCARLNLKRVSAPLFVEPSTGLNDDLNGFERPVKFDIAHTDKEGAVVHSLAKWKRMALYQYKFHPGEGLYTDMNAIRRDEVMDNLHSVYTDQWDWEKIITRADRNEEYLRRTVQGIVSAICKTSEELKRDFPALTFTPEKRVTFIDSQALEDEYPDKTPKEREKLITEKYKTVFLMRIGGKLKSGASHDGRAPDYDDWSLNGDILFYNEILKCPFEISSMGIRVDAEALESQLKQARAEDRKKFPFHRMLLENKLPLTIGGGIGQSRLSMLLLEKAHIGEVQVSIWDEETVKACEAAGITLL